MYQAGARRSLPPKPSYSLGGHLLGEALWSNRLTPLEWSISQAGWRWNRLGDLYILSGVGAPPLSTALNIKRTSLYYLTAWLYCQTITFCTDTQCSLCQSIVQLVALEALNDTHPAHKTKFMNPPSSPKMAISTKEQMCYFIWYLRIPVLVGGCTPRILKEWPFHRAL